MTRCPHCNQPIELSKPRGPKPRYDHTLAKALLDYGATPTELAAHFGVTRQAIAALKHR